MQESATRLCVIGLFSERGLGRGWVAGSPPPPGRNAKAARRKRPQQMVCTRNEVWVAGGPR
eukprot:2739519-Pyramimonas_sp.AAC.1